MKWVPDSTGRFKFRPYYEEAELDIECERIVTRFLDRKYGTHRYPLSTDDLTVMIEQDTSDLDLYADLSGMGEDVEGLTDFFPDKQPAVRISGKLTLDNRREHRLRTTLAHEYGHVKFHSFLWELSLHEKPSAGNRKIYRVFSGYDKDGSDWMEWQAGYAGEAFLMPVTPLKQLVSRYLPAGTLHHWLPDDSREAAGIIEKTSGTFNVSEKDARERLLNLGFLQKVAMPLFKY